MQVETFNQQLLGKSPIFQQVLRAAKITACTDVTVLIQGESGTGKELLAAAVHQFSKRNNGPFVTVNCAALPETLVESELFGHVKGAFTDAGKDQTGLIRSAEGGTLFLDEVGELPLGIQAKLLRFLENSECQPLGNGKSVKVNVRVIAATNRDLNEAVNEGSFRKDLFYRLNIVPLQLPALRERKDDIELLISSLTARLAQQHGLDAPRFSVQTMEQLQRYNWPGNIRELKNLCERLLILLSGQTIQPENLPLEFRQTTHQASKGDIRLPEGGIVLEQLEADLINQALDKSLGNQSKAARLLGLTRSALLYRMKKHAIG
ncbi:MAG: sigma-54 dependent transcriptional regulator [Gammaproteobacteria bacterium]|nr:sigma-54 dependent transcriptional regulator [Gammaproteobacteria bacterium]MDH5652548.1 sigma-54 dependent transcriptional regulator [Gammaproteobacteria bacterium]